MSKMNTNKGIPYNHVYHPVSRSRNHLQHSAPKSLEIRPQGNSLTRHEWEKFCTRMLTPKKLDQCSEYRHDGSLVFTGENGLDAAFELQEKYPHRFHISMFCHDKNSALVALSLAAQKGLLVSSIEYRGEKNEPITVNQKQAILDLTQEADINEILSKNTVRL